MRLTTFSDYALRVLMYAAAAGDRLITIEETALKYDISRAHLMKVVNMLTRAGYLRAVRGRLGGFTLGRPAEAIHLGDVIRATEPDFALVECFATSNQCLISGCCKLPNIMNEALNNFVSTFDRYTLASLMLEQSDFAVRSRRPVRGPKMPRSPVKSQRAAARH